MLRLPYDKIPQSLRQVDLKKGPGHDYEKSIQVRYQVMEHIKPEHYYYQYQQIAWCYKALEQPDLAYEACLKAAENHTKDADGFNYLNIFIDSIFQLKNETTIHKKGMQYLLENALANSASDIAHYFCASALNRCGEYEKAVIYAEKAISLSPHPRNYFQLANAYWGQGDDVSCLKVLRKMLEVDPMDFYEAHRAMAVVYREQGKEKQAAKVESRLEALRDHWKSLNSEPALVRDGEFRYSLFKY